MYKNLCHDSKLEGALRERSISFGIRSGLGSALLVGLS